MFIFKREIHMIHDIINLCDMAEAAYTHEMIDVLIYVLLCNLSINVWHFWSERIVELQTTGSEDR